MLASFFKSNLSTTTSRINFTSNTGNVAVVADSAAILAIVRIVRRASHRPSTALVVCAHRSSESAPVCTAGFQVVAHCRPPSGYSIIYIIHTCLHMHLEILVYYLCWQKSIICKIFTYKNICVLLFIPFLFVCCVWLWICIKLGLVFIKFYHLCLVEHWHWR